MIDKQTWVKGWALLDKREKRNAWLVLGIVIVAALSTALMVCSVMPFLAVLADPQKIQTVPMLHWAYEAGGFKSDYSFLVALGIISLLIILLSNLLLILRTWAVARFALMRIFSISQRLLAIYLCQPYEYFLNHHSGDMSTKILSESQEVVSRFLRPASELIASLLTVIAIVIVLLWVDPVIAVISFAIFGLFYGITFLLTRETIKHSGQVRADANQERFRHVNEALGGVKDIKLLGREAAYLNQYMASAHRMSRANVKIEVIAQIPNYVIQTIGFGGVILLCLIIINPAELASDKALGKILPLIGVFAFAGQRMLPELSKIYHYMTLLNAGAASVDVIHRDLQENTEIDHSLQKIPLPLGLNEQLHLDQINYSYPSADHAGLRDISFSIRAGEKIGIVGTTGSGKTTLADIILGLLSPSEGNITVDGKQVTLSNMRNWQQSVGYVPQEIFLTDTSLAENIALGLSCDEIDKDQLLKAAQISQIHNFVQDELPDGYDTLVGERGVRLSGGQRQRIGIARALYHDADLIVFDEATSALDNLTESEVMAAIDGLPGDKTIILIAHRLSTVRSCDKLLVLSEGRLASIGTWDELSATCEEFQKIVNSASKKELN